MLHKMEIDGSPVHIVFPEMIELDNSATLMNACQMHKSVVCVPEMESMEM